MHNLRHIGSHNPTIVTIHTMIDYTLSGTVWVLQRLTMLLTAPLSSMQDQAEVTPHVAHATPHRQLQPYDS